MFNRLIAQTLVATLLAVAPMQAMAKQVTLPAQTPVKLISSMPISAKYVRNGDPVQTQLAEPLVVDGVEIAKAGQPVTLYVEKAKKPSVFGRGGYLHITRGNLTTNQGSVLNLAASEHVDGDDKASSIYLPIISLVVVWPLIFTAFRKGDEAVIPAGKVIPAMTSGPLTVELPDIAPMYNAAHAG